MGCKIDISNLLMFRFTWPALIGVSIIANAFAQSPAPSRSPSPSAATKAAGKSIADPSPLLLQRAEDLIDSLNAADLQAAITLLKSNFTNPDLITETELNRATLEGLLVRLNHGLTLLPGAATRAAGMSVLWRDHRRSHRLFAARIAQQRQPASNGQEAG